MPKELVIGTVTKAPQLASDLAAGFKGAGLAVRVAGPETAPGAADLVIIDRRGMDAAELGALLGAHGPRALLLSDHEDKDNINQVLAAYPVRHVIGWNGRSYLRELIVTLRKYTSGQIFGLDQYLDGGATIETRLLTDAGRIDATIEDMLSRTNLEASFSATHEFLRMTANELVTNAVYNAPVDGAMKPKYEATDRRQKIKLLPGEAVSLTFGFDESYVAVAVADRFGRLDRDKIVRHLVKCVNNTKFIEDKRGGAGAGIYLAFYTASQFIINVESGRRLEAICILEKNKRYKEYRSRVTSFSYFVAGQSASRRGEGAA